MADCQDSSGDGRNSVEAGRSAEEGRSLSPNVDYDGNNPAKDGTGAVKESQPGSSDARYDVSNAADSAEVDVRSRAATTRSSCRERVARGLTALGNYKETWFDPPRDPSAAHSYLPLLTRRFRCATCFVTCGTILWSIYYGVATENPTWGFPFLVALLLFTELSCLGFTLSPFYRKFHILPSLLIGPGTCFTILLVYACVWDPDYEVPAFGASVTIIIIMYTTLHLPLRVVSTVGLLHSVALEALNAYVAPFSARGDVITGRVLLHGCLHSLGAYFYVVLQVRRFSLFRKLHQWTRNKRTQEEDKKIIERMLHSLMPPAVAKNVIDKQAPSQKGVITFRPFQIDRIDHVSILFADIVGFTKMSSNKTAKHLVDLLSDLFGRFDQLCETLGCEKISTLGDCYYCVSGCPEENKDHAKCCVEMGLRMIEAIQDFDRENNEQVDMRVGVHTGTVLCGIVGSKQFKFDVWSNDVTLANIMEATGKPGRVHISKTSYEYLEDEYEVEEGEDCEDNRTVASLIERYDAENKKYTVTHQEKKQKITTFFIVKRKEKDAALKDVTPACLALENEEGSTKDPADMAEKLEPIDYVSPVPLLNKDKNQTENFLFKEEDPAKENPDGVTAEEVEANLDTIRRSFHAPPLHPCLLTFDNEDIEQDLRTNSVTEAPETLHVRAETLMSFLTFLLISLACFLMLQRPLAWLVLFPLLFILEALLVSKTLLCHRVAFLDGLPNSWVIRSVEATLLATAPVLGVFANLYCPGLEGRVWPEQSFCITFTVALLNLATFTTVNSLMRSTTAVLASTIFILIHALTACAAGDPSAAFGPSYENSSDVTPTVTQTAAPGSILTPAEPYMFLIDLNTILHLFLIVFLNREFEVGYRICYHCDAAALACQRHIKENKDQLEWLLHNIIPEHISSKLVNGRYSKNHQHIGVIFAGLVNFNELYEESYQGGREMLRVLNELVGDYEDLLDDPRFGDVEKIKTITSTFMAASGLNEQKRRRNNHRFAHLFNLMVFAMEMQRVIENFNRSMINFEFVLNVGYNFGEVTAGVIGTTKLLFDIWGDTVNVSSRMYTNGSARRIQVPASNIEILSEMFEFEYRGTILIKGKGEMGTYLLVKQKEGATWD